MHFLTYLVFFFVACIAVIFVIIFSISYILSGIWPYLLVGLIGYLLYRRYNPKSPTEYIPENKRTWDKDKYGF